MAGPDLKIRSIYFEWTDHLRLRQALLADIVWIILGGFSLIGLIVMGLLVTGWSPYLSLVRVPLALVFVLFVPGYLLQCVLFPRQVDLEGIERIGLSQTLSVTLISILALVLNGFPWGFSLWSIVLGQSALILFLVIILMVLRFTSPGDQVYAPQLRLLPKVLWTTLRKKDQGLITLLAVTLLILGLGTTWIFVAPSDTEFMTEFYILGKGGMAEDYPRSTVVSEPIRLITGVANLEREPAVYWIIIKLGDRTIGGIEPFSLKSGETWRGQLSFAIPEVGDNQRVDILLGRENHEFPYRSLRIWLDVKPDL